MLNTGRNGAFWHCLEGSSREDHNEIYRKSVTGGGKREKSWWWGLLEWCLRRGHQSYHLVNCERDYTLGSIPEEHCFYFYSVLPKRKETAQIPTLYPARRQCEGGSRDILRMCWKKAALAVGSCLSLTHIPHFCRLSWVFPVGQRWSFPLFSDFLKDILLFAVLPNVTILHLQHTLLIH